MSIIDLAQALCISQTTIADVFLQTTESSAFDGGTKHPAGTLHKISWEKLEHGKREKAQLLGLSETLLFQWIVHILYIVFEL